MRYRFILTSPAYARIAASFWHVHTAKKAYRRHPESPYSTSHGARVVHVINTETQPRYQESILGKACEDTDP